ncbi:MAG: OmpA family protein [Methylococcales bacterium]|nr:OmpA family protein [Methylococcales bacterium]
MSLHEKPEDRYDTLIGVILAFAMAVGVYVYSIKPKISKVPSFPVVVQSGDFSAVSAERVSASAEHIMRHAPAAEGVTPALAPISVPLAAVAIVAPLVDVPSSVAATMMVAPLAPPVALVPVAEVAAKPIATPIPVEVPPVLTVEAAPPIIVAEPAPVEVIPVISPVAEVVSVTEVPVIPEVAPVVAAIPDVTPVVEASVVPVVAETAPAAVEPALAPNVVIRETFQFPMGSARIPESAKPRLLEGVALLKNDTRKLKIVGHTDNIGYTGANRRLSLRRAHAVKVFLVSAGLNPGLLSVQGVGESQPIADNLTEEGRYQNRRIDIVE